MSGIDQRHAAMNGDDVLLKQYIEARCNVCSTGTTLMNLSVVDDDDDICRLLTTLQLMSNNFVRDIFVTIYVR